MPGMGSGEEIVGKEALEAERPRALAAKILARPPRLALRDDQDVPRAIYRRCCSVCRCIVWPSLSSTKSFCDFTV